MGKVRLIASNAKTFTDASSSVPGIVASGDAGAGMVIDFYGRSQVEAVGESRMGYLEPAGATAINPDPIALVRGAEHRELAMRFIEFVLSERGQKLWNTRAGARFETYVNAAEEHAFNLYAGNGEVVLRSEGYSSEAAALNGTFAVVENGANRARYEVAESADGRFYINLRARNGEIVGTSELYDNVGNAERAVEDLIELLPTLELL